jgi:hypothetical protein
MKIICVEDDPGTAELYFQQFPNSFRNNYLYLEDRPLLAVMLCENECIENYRQTHNSENKWNINLCSKRYENKNLTEIIVPIDCNLPVSPTNLADKLNELIADCPNNDCDLFLLINSPSACYLESIIGELILLGNFFEIAIFDHQLGGRFNGAEMLQLLNPGSCCLKVVMSGVRQVNEAACVAPQVLGNIDLHITKSLCAAMAAQIQRAYMDKVNYAGYTGKNYSNYGEAIRDIFFRGESGIRRLIHIEDGRDISDLKSDLTLLKLVANAAEGKLQKELLSVINDAYNAGIRIVNSTDASHAKVAALKGIFGGQGNQTEYLLFGRGEIPLKEQMRTRIKYVCNCTNLSNGEQLKGDTSISNLKEYFYVYRDVFERTLGELLTSAKKLGLYKVQVDGALKYLAAVFADNTVENFTDLLEAAQGGGFLPSLSNLSQYMMVGLVNRDSSSLVTVPNRNIIDLTTMTFIRIGETAEFRHLLAEGAAVIMMQGLR